MALKLTPFIRFLIVGGGFSLLFSVTTAVLINLFAAPPFLTSAVVYLACIPAAFQTHKRFAFAVRKTRKSAFWTYVLTQFCSLAFVSGASSYLVTYTLWLDTIVLLCASALAAVFSFLVGRFVTFAAPS